MVNFRSFLNSVSNVFRPGSWGRYQFPQDVYASAMGSGIQLDKDSALCLSAVLSAVKHISENCSSFPLRVKRWDAALGAKVCDHDHPVARMLNTSWDGGQTAAIFSRREAMKHCLTWGQSLGVIVYDDAGQVLGIQQVHPERVRAEYADNGEVVYQVRGAGLPFRASKVVHFKHLTIDSLNGKSPIELMANSLGLYANAEAFAEANFKNGGNQKGFIVSPDAFTQEKANQLKAAANSGGVHTSNGYGVLMGGASFQPTTLSPEAAQLIASRTFSVQDVARAYNIPPHKLAELSRGTFSNIEEMNLDYVQGTLFSWLDAIEAELSLKLFTSEERAQGYCVDHDVSTLLRGNMEQRGNFYAQMLDRGVFTINMVLVKEGERPIGPEGDHRLVQLNQTTVANVGKAGPEGVERSLVDAIAARVVSQLGLK